MMGFDMDSDAWQAAGTTVFRLEDVRHSRLTGRQNAFTIHISPSNEHSHEEAAELADIITGLLNQYHGKTAPRRRGGVRRVSTANRTEPETVGGDVVADPANPQAIDDKDKNP